MLRIPLRVESSEAVHKYYFSFSLPQFEIRTGVVLREHAVAFENNLACLARWQHALSGSLSPPFCLPPFVIFLGMFLPSLPAAIAPAQRNQAARQGSGHRLLGCRDSSKFGGHARGWFSYFSTILLISPFFFSPCALHFFGRSRAHPATIIVIEHEYPWDP